MFNPSLLLFVFATACAICPPGAIYESYFNKCYQFIATPLSFADSEKHCNSVGGHLSSVENAFENTYLAGIASGASSNTPNFWIGAHLLPSSKWIWTSNETMSYTNWAKGQPNNSNSCGYVRNSDANWVTAPCNTAMPFMCSTNPNTKPTTTAAPCPNVECTDDFTLFTGNCLCYKYFFGTVSFSKASSACVGLGGMLAKVPSKEINDFLTVLPGFECGSTSCPYIGLTCMTSEDSSCTWMDGSSLGEYTNFYTHENSTLSYVLITNTKIERPGDGKWDGKSDSRSYICQKNPQRLSEEKT